MAVEVTVVSTISANVRVGDELSTCEPALSGVPHFGAPAVSFVINDLPAITTNITTLFADDSQSPATIQSDFHCLFLFN